MSAGDLEPFSESLDEVFTRLGLPDPVLISQISDEWEDLAGKPWTGRSKPLYVKGRTLVIEASSPSMIAFLRYGESALLKALDKRFGTGVVMELEIAAPGRK
jgi:hypothetical protein